MVLGEKNMVAWIERYTQIEQYDWRIGIWM